MKIRATLKCIVLILLLAGCYPDDFFEINKEAFYKLYGNGTYQEAVAMSLTKGGEIYILGNQYVRNQDSSAVIVIRADKSGNQLWSRKYYGKGHSIAKSILPLPSNEWLVLSSTRAQDQSRSIPVLYRLSEQGELLKEYVMEQENREGAASPSFVPEDMVLSENGNLILVGNIRSANGVSQGSFLEKIDLETGEILDRRDFSNSESTEVKQVFRFENKYLVVGNSKQEVGEMSSQNIFMATFSEEFVEASQVVLGGPQNDAFRKAIFSSRYRFVLGSTEQIENSTATRGVIHFIDPQTLSVKEMAHLDYSANEIPTAIEEDENGDFYVAVNSVDERGNADILINKIGPTGVAGWDSPRFIGGEGNDKIAQVKIKDGYVYLLKTVDMQNENTLISLSKIQF